MDQGSVSITQISAALLLFSIMTIVGLELRPDDFRRVMRYPRAVVWGTIAQLVLLPIGTFALLDLMGPPPTIAAGMILILAAPGGGISNVFALLAGANPALSVTLTAVASLLAAATFPLIAAIGLDRLDMGESTAIELPLLPMMGQLVVLVIVPIGLGMWMRQRRPEIQAWGPALRRAAFAGAAVMITLSVITDDSGLASTMREGFVLSLAWTAMALALGYGVGVALRLPLADRVTLTIEFGVKNVALSAIVAMAALERPDLAVFAGAYVTTAYPIVGVGSVLLRRFIADSDRGPDPDPLAASPGGPRPGPD